MNFLNYYVSALKNYAAFSGRASRAEFWWFGLVNFLIGLVLTGIGDAIGNNILSDVYSLAVVVPSIALSARRLHDTDRSAWWLLLYFFLVIGWIWLIVLWCLEGTTGPNKHGANPKSVGGAAYVR